MIALTAKRKRQWLQGKARSPGGTIRVEDLYRKARPAPTLLCFLSENEYFVLSSFGVHHSSSPESSYNTTPVLVVSK